MRQLHYILFFLMMFLPAYGQNVRSSLLSGPADIIPKPVRFDICDGYFTVMDGMKYFIEFRANGYSGDQDKDIANLNIEIQSLPFCFVQTGDRKEAEILITVGQKKPVSDIMADETYEIKIAHDKIDIDAVTAAGAFYAFQSLVQMAEKSRNIQCCIIDDWPRFRYR